MRPVVGVVSKSPRLTLNLRFSPGPALAKIQAPEAPSVQLQSSQYQLLPPSSTSSSILTNPPAPHNNYSNEAIPTPGNHFLGSTSSSYVLHPIRPSHREHWLFSRTRGLRQLPHFAGGRRSLCTSTTTYAASINGQQEVGRCKSA